MTNILRYLSLNVTYVVLVVDVDDVVIDDVDDVVIVVVADVVSCC